jgi:hypothetical protein
MYSVREHIQIMRVGQMFAGNFGYKPDTVEEQLNIYSPSFH